MLSQFQYIHDTEIETNTQGEDTQIGVRECDFFSVYLGLWSCGVDVKLSWYLMLFDDEVRTSTA